MVTLLLQSSVAVGVLKLHALPQETVLGLEQWMTGGIVSMIETVWLQKLLKPHGFETSQARVISLGQSPLVTVLNTVVVLLQLLLITTGGSNDQAEPQGADLLVVQLSTGTGFVTVTV